MAADNFFEIEEEELPVEPNGQEEEETEGEAPEGETEGEGEPVEGEEEPEVVFEEDKKYSKKNWSVDPVKNAEGKNDKDYSEDVQKRINTLRASLTEAGRQRDVHARDVAEAQRYLATLRAENETLKKQLHAGKLSTLKSQAEAFEAQAKTARKEVEDAINTSNTAALLDAQERMNKAQSQAAMLRREVETTPEVPVVQQQPVQQPQQPQQQPVDTSKADQWMASNPWFKMSQRGQALNAESVTAIEAHHEALESGIPQGSDAYFSYINKSVKAAHPELFKSTKKASSTVVPSSRVATGQQANQGGKQKFIIKPETRRLAEKLGFTTPEEIKAFAIEQHKSEKEPRS